MWRRQREQIQEIVQEIKARPGTDITIDIENERVTFGDKTISVQGLAYGERFADEGAVGPDCGAFRGERRGFGDGAGFAVYDALRY